ncbi:MAG: phosphate ABC transporter permease PstA [Candidatus Margulisiibacteriota bacterium]|jgi:phosphate transport system permease protein
MVRKIRKKKNLKTRIFFDYLFRAIILLFTLLLFMPLIMLLFFIVANGLPALNFDFFTKLPTPIGSLEKGGILNSLVGSGLLISLSLVISIPFGILTGIFLSEYKNHPLASFTRLAVNVLQGIPSIVIGIIIYVWIVMPFRNFSLLAGSIALSLIMLPLTIKSTEETFHLIPLSLKEASLALGVPYYRTIIKVILPTGFSSILSGILLGIARISGETAPLLFTAFGNPHLNFNLLKPTNSLPLLIYNYALSPYQEWQKAAWGASLVLVIFVLALGIIARIFLAYRQ